MRLADFQNPIANMPIVQQIQQNQHTQVQSVPFAFQQHIEEQVKEELTTVRESKENSEKDKINDEDAQRGDIARRMPRRRAKAPLPEEEKPAAKKARMADGIHGRFLDIEG